MRRRSISLRLTIRFSVIFFLGWVLFGAAMWFDLQHTLTAKRSLTLIRRADRLTHLLRKLDNDPQKERKFRDFANATGQGLIEVFYPNGTRAFPSPSSGAAAFPWPAINGTGGEQFSRVSFLGEHYHVLVYPVTVASQQFYLCAAAPLASNEELLRRFFFGLLAAAPILLLISAASGYALSRKALDPVDRVTASVRRISMQNLSERLPVTDSRDELQRLTETCNGMLARLESAANELKQFTADASHELRNPISLIRTVAEVNIRNRNIDPESRVAFQDIVGECTRAGDLLENMLTLARADSCDSIVTFEPLNLADVVHEACEKFRPIAETQGHILTFCKDTRDQDEIYGNEPYLRRLLLILLDNAAKYTPTPGTIKVTLKTVEDKVMVMVHDNGMGIQEADLPRIFQRFYRADPSRSQVEGTGLGLAIAKWIADIHHAGLSVTSKENAGTIFQIVFPLCRENYAAERIQTSSEA